MKTIIENVRFFQDGTMVFGDLHLENGYVERIDYKTPRGLSDLAIPGFIDIHTHGFHMISCEETDPKMLQELSLEYVKRGTTSFCATLRCKSLNDYAKQLDIYKEAFKDFRGGARYLGAHLEGPYLSDNMIMSEHGEKTQEIDLAELEKFLVKYHDDIKIMTIAPELKYAMEAIHMLHMYGIIVSLGHTNASYACVKEALENGATHVTHLCNRMPEINHKQSTMMDAIFTSNCLCELILDGTHIKDAMLEWLMPLLGSKRILAVSGSGRYAGWKYPNGLTSHDHEVLKDKCVYKDGILYESTIDMLDAFRYLYDKFPLQECIEMCGGSVAKEFKCYTQTIGLGKKVDLVVLNHDLKIRDVIMDGRSVL